MYFLIICWLCQSSQIVYNIDELVFLVYAKKL